MAPKMSLKSSKNRCQNRSKTWTNGRKALQIYFSDFFFIVLGSHRAMAGTYRGVLACSAGSLRHGILDRISNWNEKADSATCFPRMVEQTGSSFRNYIFEKALEASITCNLLGICIVRMIPKPSKNGSAFCQKNIKIQAWRHQDRGLEGSGAGLEASWAILGHPGRLWKRLGPSWKRLGSLPGCFGPKKLANMAPRWLPKRKPNL